jgi:hypothetical protein
MGTLSREQATTFEDHYITCDQCATVLQGSAEYIEAMGAAAKRVRSEAQRSATMGQQA